MTETLKPAPALYATVCRTCGLGFNAPSGTLECQECIVRKHEYIPSTPKRVKPKSRPQRWADACSAARDALSNLQESLQELNDLRSEYEDWKDNLPESLQSSAVAEKLETVCDLDFDGAADEVESLLDEAENADLPRGFGRD